MDFQHFIEWSFLGLMSCLIGIIWQAKKSVDELNIKIAVIIEKINNHDERIKILESSRIKDK